MLESKKSKLIFTIVTIVCFGIMVVVGMNQSQARQEAKIAEEAEEQARIEAIDKLNEGIVADFGAVKEGMGYSEVLKLVGEPYQKDVATVDATEFDSVMWSYGGKGIIVFVDGRVQMTSY